MPHIHVCTHTYLGLCYAEQQVLFRVRGLDCIEMTTDLFIRTKHLVSLDNSIGEGSLASIIDSSPETARP